MDQQTVQSIRKELPQDLVRLFDRARVYGQSDPHVQVNEGMLLSALMTFYDVWLEAPSTSTNEDLTVCLVSVYRNMKPFYVPEGSTKASPYFVADGVHFYLPPHCFLVNEMAAIYTLNDLSKFDRESLLDELGTFFIRTLRGRSAFSTTKLKQILASCRI